MSKPVWKGVLLFTVLLIASMIPLFDILDLQLVRGDTTATQVTITGVSPFILRSEMNIFVNIGDESIALLENVSTVVTCNATIRDNNGFNDISTLTGTLYDNENSNSGAADDNNDHYTNGSCTLFSGATIKRGGFCTFSVFYYANNQTWACNLTAVDGGSLQNSTYLNKTLDALVALNVPSALSFGTLNPGDNSSTLPLNITNTGNRHIDLIVYAFANNFTTSPNSFNCSSGSVANITLEQLRYNATNVTGTPACGNVTFFGNSTVVFNITNQETLGGFNLEQRTSDTIAAIATTCWVMQVPLTGVGGQCTGVISFTAIQSPN